MAHIVLFMLWSLNIFTAGARILTWGQARYVYAIEGVTYVACTLSLRYQVI